MYIQLESFEGPFDLLLRLIEKSEIDIYDIPISHLTEQYLEAIKELPRDMEDMSEFLVMAATLLEIKSRMLLPRHSADEEEEDPREALVRQLIAYKHCQQLAEALKSVPDSGMRLFKGPEQPLMSKATTHHPKDWLEDVEISGLMEIFADVMKRRISKVDTVRYGFGTVHRERFTVSEKVSLIAKYIKEGLSVKISELFANCSSKEECIVTFLALLEIVRRRKAAISQDGQFGEIEVSPC